VTWTVRTSGDQEILQTSPSFQFILANGVVSDIRTGLQWAPKDNGRDINWENAHAYCQRYTGGGFTDWRLPTFIELESLYKAGIRNKPGDIINITGCYPWLKAANSIDFRDGKYNSSFKFYSAGRRALPVRSAGKKRSLATHKKLYDFFDVFKAAAIERDVEKMRNLSHPLYLSCVNDKFYQKIINILYFDVFNKNMEIKEVKVEDISKEDKEAIIKEGQGLKMAVFPDKRISFSYGGEVAGGGYSGGGGFILLSLHNGEWKWVSFCSPPSVNK